MKVKNAESYLTELKRIDKNFSSTAETLNEITNKFYLSSLFDEIIEDETCISQIASKSYHHDNGFEKLTVFKGVNYNLRIHIYWNSIKHSKPNIHDHRWDFSSMILNGGYISELYEIADKGIEKQMYLYYSQEKLDGKYSLYNKGKVFLKKTESREYNKSDVNNSKATEIHSILYTKKEPTITLFVTSKYKTEYARVFSDSHKENKKIEAKTMSVNEVVATLNKVLNIII